MVERATERGVHRTRRGHHARRRRDLARRHRPGRGTTYFYRVQAVERDRELGVLGRGERDHGDRDAPRARRAERPDRDGGLGDADRHHWADNATTRRATSSSAARARDFTVADRDHAGRRRDVATPTPALAASTQLLLPRARRANGRRRRPGRTPRARRRRRRHAAARARRADRAGRDGRVDDARSTCAWTDNASERDRLRRRARGDVGRSRRDHGHCPLAAQHAHRPDTGARRRDDATGTACGRGATGARLGLVERRERGDAEHHAAARPATRRRSPPTRRSATGGSARRPAPWRRTRAARNPGTYRNGTLLGQTVAARQRRRDRAVRLDGTNDYVDVPRPRLARLHERDDASRRGSGPRRCPTAGGWASIVDQGRGLLAAVQRPAARVHGHPERHPPPAAGARRDDRRRADLPRRGHLRRRDPAPLRQRRAGRRAGADRRGDGHRLPADDRLVERRRRVLPRQRSTRSRSTTPSCPRRACRPTTPRAARPPRPRRARGASRRSARSAQRRCGRRSSGRRSGGRSRAAVRAASGCSRCPPGGRGRRAGSRSLARLGRGRGQGLADRGEPLADRFVRARAGHGAHVAHVELGAAGRRTCAGRRRGRRSRGARRPAAGRPRRRGGGRPTASARRAPATGRGPLGEPVLVARRALLVQAPLEQPASTRRCRRVLSTLRAMPRLRWKSSKRRTPRNASRRMRIVHRSPITSSARATEHDCPSYVLCSTSRMVPPGCVMGRPAPR